MYMCVCTHTHTHTHTYRHTERYINWWDIHKILKVHLLRFLVSHFLLQLPWWLRQ